MRSSVELRALSARRLGRTVYDVEDVTLSVGSGDTARTLLADATWHVGPGDRIGIIGVNGSGKTHLLRLLAGELAPDCRHGGDRPDRPGRLPVPGRHRAAVASCG